jgi:BD-FAE protein
MNPTTASMVALLGTSGGVTELEGHGNDLKESSRVQAVVDWFGPTDFLQIGNAESDLQQMPPNFYQLTPAIGVV